MSKFEKRLRKTAGPTENVLVVGNAFGHLEHLLSIYKTVFVIGEKAPPIKARNLVYKNNFDNLNNISEVGVIFFDLGTLNQLENLKDFWSRHNSSVLIEGNEPIERDLSKPLYDTGWGCTDLQGFYHVWKKLK